MPILRHLLYFSMASALPIAVIAWHFPYATDDPVRREDAIREFYEIAWAAGTPVMKDTEVARRAIPAYLAFDIPALIAYISTVTELLPGDIIATGTPSGVGLFREPRLFMKAGDRIEVEISGIGTLANSVVDEG